MGDVDVLKIQSMKRVRGGLNGGLGVKGRRMVLYPMV